MDDNMEKKLIVGVIAMVLLIVATIGVAYSFFNYTRTGTANTVSVGRITFNSQQTDTFNLTNIIPINSYDVDTDTDNVGIATITISGDTTYSQGVEYLISATDVTNSIGTKSIPISISVIASGTLGTSDDDYFDDRDTATSHIYKVLANEIIGNNESLIVGYVANNVTGINGSITIKTYIDEDDVAVSDTYDGTQNDNMGTTTNWVSGRTVLTTTEWNSLNSQGISFKVKVEANEGIWVGDPTSRNDMTNFNLNSLITNEQKSAISEIIFVRMNESEINTHADLINLTDSNGSGVVKGWIENNKLYIASPGITYFPQNSSGLFYNFSSVQTIVFNNVNTSNVTLMPGLFSSCSNLVNINLNSFDTSNVTDMSHMFYNCANLVNINLSSLDTSNVTSMNSMFMDCTNLEMVDLSGLGGNNLTSVGVGGIFSGCTSLIEVNMSNFNFGIATISGSFVFGFNSSVVSIDLSNANMSNVTDMSAMFMNCTNLTNIDLTGINTSNVTTMAQMFMNCTNLVSVDLSSFDTSNVIATGSMFDGCTNLVTIFVGNNWTVTAATNSNYMFNNCISLKGGGTPQTAYDSSHINKEYARIDGGLNSATPGYLTLKTS